jgi:hypothetical protein
MTQSAEMSVEEASVVSPIGGAEDVSKPEGISRTPHWPDYFARLGQPDAANWQYQGYWKDTFTVWRAYYTLVIGHPIVTFYGMRHFFQSLIYRISNEHTGEIRRGDCAALPETCAQDGDPAVIPAIQLHGLGELQRHAYHDVHDAQLSAVPEGLGSVPRAAAFVEDFLA